MFQNQFPIVSALLKYGKTLLHEHVGKAVLWLVFGIALTSSNLIHLVYLLLVLITSVSSRKGMHPKVGGVLLCFGQLVCLVQVVFGFASVQAKLDKNTKEFTHWLGLEVGRPWDALSFHLAIVVIVLLRRLEVRVCISPRNIND